jgi:hypothetical protein
VGGVEDVEEVVAVVAVVEEEDLPWLENIETTLIDRMAKKILLWLELMIYIRAMQPMVGIITKLMIMRNNRHYLNAKQRLVT